MLLSLCVLLMLLEILQSERHVHGLTQTLWDSGALKHQWETTDVVSKENSLVKPSRTQSTRQVVNSLNYHQTNLSLSIKC